MELGAIIEYIQQLPKQAQTALLRELKLTDAGHMPAGAVLVAMQLLTVLGVLRQIDLVLGEEHTSIGYLKQEMDAGRKQVPAPISEKRFRELVNQAWEKEQWKDINYRNAEEIRKKRERSYQAYEAEWALTETEKPELPPDQTRRTKGSIIRHEVIVRLI